MRIKFFFHILVFMLLALGGILLFFAQQNRLFFYIGEGWILLVLLYLLFFYRKLVKPLNTIGNGMELLREQDFSSRLSSVGQYEVDRIVNIFNRMMNQLRNERLCLREQNHFLDLLIKASPMGVIIMNLDEELSELNPMALRMLGVCQEDVLGKKMAEVASPLASELATVTKGSTVTIRLNDSTIYRCIHSSFVDRGFQHPFFLVESLTDEVMKAEKKAYGKVIRMIAHEVNNTTAGLVSTLETIDQMLAETEEMKDVCDVMRICSDRCLSMSRFITCFSDVVKIPAPTLSPVCPNELVFAGKRFMEGMCHHHRIRLRIETDDHVKKVMADVVLFEQVLVNILKNAVESIGTDGEIVIRTFSPAIIEVTDNGKGISKETEAKLFTPFFSTKPSGQGIGLLFIREVLMSHGCTFFLRTDTDGLTRFRIVFP